jgi:leucyl-tRNA synthetase
MVIGDGDTPALLSDEPADPGVEQSLHRLIRKVGEDIDAMKFNTAIAAMMEFVNAVFRAGRIARDQAERFVLVLTPFAPHIAEEIWQRLGHGESLAGEPWPKFDPSVMVEQQVELVVQVNGKVRGRIRVPADAPEADVIAAALAEPRVAAAAEGRNVVKTILVPGRLVNIVAR